MPSVPRSPRAGLLGPHKALTAHEKLCLAKNSKVLTLASADHSSVTSEGRQRCSDGTEKSRAAWAKSVSHMVVVSQNRVKVPMQQPSPRETPPLVWFEKLCCRGGEDLASAAAAAATTGSKPRSPSRRTRRMSIPTGSAIHLDRMFEVRNGSASAGSSEARKSVRMIAGKPISTTTGEYSGDGYRQEDHFPVTSNLKQVLKDYFQENVCPIGNEQQLPTLSAWARRAAADNSPHRVSALRLNTSKPLSDIGQLSGRSQSFAEQRSDLEEKSHLTVTERYNRQKQPYPGIPISLKTIRGAVRARAIERPEFCSRVGHAAPHQAQSDRLAPVQGLTGEDEVNTERKGPAVIAVLELQSTHQVPHIPAPFAAVELSPEGNRTAPAVQQSQLPLLTNLTDKDYRRDSVEEFMREIDSLTAIDGDMTENETTSLDSLRSIALKFLDQYETKSASSHDSASSIKVDDERSNDEDEVLTVPPSPHPTVRFRLTKASSQRAKLASFRFDSKVACEAIVMKADDSVALLNRFVLTLTADTGRLILSRGSQRKEYRLDDLESVDCSPTCLETAKRGSTFITKGWDDIQTCLLQMTKRVVCLNYSSRKFPVIIIFEMVDDLLDFVELLALASRGKSVQWNQSRYQSIA